MSDIGGRAFATAVDSFFKGYGQMDTMRAEKLRQKEQKAKLQEYNDNIAREKAMREGLAALPGQMAQPQGQAQVLAPVPQAEIYNPSTAINLPPQRQPGMGGLLGVQPFTADRSLAPQGMSMPPQGMGIPSGIPTQGGMQGGAPGGVVTAPPVNGSIGPGQGIGQGLNPSTMQLSGLMAPIGEDSNLAPREYQPAFTGEVVPQYANMMEKWKQNGLNPEEEYIKAQANIVAKSDPLKAMSIFDALYRDKSRREAEKATLTEQVRQHNENKKEKERTATETERHNKAVEETQKQNADTAKKAAERERVVKATADEKSYAEYSKAYDRNPTPGTRKYSSWEWKNFLENQSQIAKDMGKNGAAYAGYNGANASANTTPGNQGSAKQQGPASSQSGFKVGAQYRDAKGNVKTYKGKINGQDKFE